MDGDDSGLPRAEPHECRREADALITAATVLGILQSKARAVLDSQPAT